jgi:hypothetical protein
MIQLDRARIPDDIQRDVDAFNRRQRRAPAATRKSLAAQIKEMIIAFTANLRWSLRIPGQHYSGLSNQELLAVRIKEGRDFDANTVQLKQHVRKELLERYAGFSRLPTEAEIKSLAGRIIVLYIANERVMWGGGDISLEPLTPAYAAWKAKHGGGGKPIGVLKGRWLAALRKATVEWS